MVSDNNGKVLSFVTAEVIIIGQANLNISFSSPPASFFTYWIFFSIIHYCNEGSVEHWTHALLTLYLGRAEKLH